MKEASKPTSQVNPLRFRTAVLADVEALARLINAAFRVEQPFIEGDRIDPEGVTGCVYVELRGDRGYLGLLGVEPRRQGTGLGRKLMDAAEKFFRETGCVAVDLRVVSARTPLPSFYRHLGYLETGAAPFSPDVPAKVPCHYILMCKILA